MIGWIPRYAPTPRLAALVALLSPLWLSGTDGLTALPGWVALAAVVLATVWDAASLPGENRIEIARDLPPVVGLGDRASGTLTLRSSWPRALRGTAHLQTPVAIELDDARPLTVAMPPNALLAVPLGIRGRARGEVPLGPVAIQLFGPLDLVRRTLRWSTDDRITIAPSLAGIRRYRLLAVQRRLRDVGIRAIRRRGESTTFDRLREYSRGDDPRHVDWKASARHGALVTREYTVEQGQSVLIAIDCGRMMTQWVGDMPRIEYALSAALVLADIATAGDDRVGVIAFDDQVRAWVPPARGRAAVRAVRDALVPLEARLVEPDYAGAFRALAANQRKRALIVLFTDLVDARASQPLLAHLSRAAATHLPLVVALRNESLVHAAAGTGGADAWTRGAAEELLAERDTALLALRRRGIAVLDVPPTGMTAAVINRYLEIKARSAL